LQFCCHLTQPSSSGQSVLGGSAVKRRANGCPFFAVQNTAGSSLCGHKGKQRKEQLGESDVE